MKGKETLMEQMCLTPRKKKKLEEATMTQPT